MMNTKERLPLNFAFLSMSIYIFGFWLFPYYNFKVVTVYDCIAYILTSFLVLVPVALVVFRYYEFTFNVIKKIYAFGAATIGVVSVAKYLFQTIFDREVVCVFFILDFFTIVGLSWICKIADNGKSSSKVVVSKRYVCLMAVELVCLIAVMIFVQMVITQRSSNIYNKGSESYQYSLQHLQWIVTAGGFVVVGLASLFSLPILARKESGGKNKYVLRSTVLILVAIYCVSCVRLKGLIYPKGSIIRVATTSSRCNRSVVDEMRFSNPFWVETTSRSIQRWDGKQISEEVLLTKTVYDSTNRIKARVLVTDFSDYYTLQIGETVVGVEYPYFLMFFEGDQQKIYSLNTLGKAERNEILIDFSRNRIEAGDFRLFKQYASYLCQYDTEFVHPFLQRYIRLEFTENEREALVDIREEYIFNVASELLQKIEN